MEAGSLLEDSAARTHTKGHRRARGRGRALERRAVAGTGGTRALARMGGACFPLVAHGASRCLLAQALADGLLVECCMP